MNKKGAEMTIGTIIVIILALVVLVVIVYGFTTGWGNLWEKITGFGGGKVNVQSVVQSCQLACTTSSTYDYCKTRNLIKADADGNPEDAIQVDCKDLELPKYGLDECDIKCDETDAEKEAREAKEAIEEKCKNLADKTECDADTDCEMDGLNCVPV